MSFSPYRYPHLIVETGGCPHAAIREDISANLHACEVLTASFTPLDIILLESGGDNLAANFSPELADFTIYVIDVAGGDKVPRKGGPGVTQSDVLVINKVCTVVCRLYMCTVFMISILLTLICWLIGYLVTWLLGWSYVE